ncbi:Protein unc-13 D [Bulinus truncatus]|nr:Protein unc-13 D [Bulinus truncatus]
MFSICECPLPENVLYLRMFSTCECPPPEKVLHLRKFSTCECPLPENDDKDYDRPPPVEIQFATKPQLQKPSRKEFELLYIEVLYTIKHKIGTTSGGHSPYIQDLFQYAKEAFGVSPEDHARLLAKATEEKQPPIVILNVSVIEASGLEAKDADGRWRLDKR